LKPDLEKHYHAASSGWQRGWAGPRSSLDAAGGI